MKPPLERRTVQAVDVETGEVVEGLPVYVRAKVRWHEDFFMAIQRSFEQLAKEPRMTFEARRVLDFCLARMGFENHIHIPQQEIAEELGMRQPHVSRAFKLLVEIGILLEGPKIGRSKSYRLNSRYGWKGKVHTLSNRRREESELHRKRSKEPAMIYPIADLFGEENGGPWSASTTPDQLDTWVANRQSEIKEVWRKNPVRELPEAIVLFKDGTGVEIVGWMGSEPTFRFLSEDEVERFSS